MRPVTIVDPDPSSRAAAIARQGTLADDEVGGEQRPVEIAGDELISAESRRKA